MNNTIIMNDNTNTIIRKHFTVKGWVQGVGFRFRTACAAKMFDVTGWVHNEFDGSVTLELQGTREQIDKTFAQLNRGKYVLIEDMDVETIHVVEDERDFRIW